MNPWLGIVAGAALLVAAIVLLRTRLSSSRQLTARPLTCNASTRTAPEPGAAAGRLAEAIRFQTVSHQEAPAPNAEEFLGLHRYLEEAFPRVHSTLKREVVNRYSLLYTWEGSSEELKSILFSAHLDVVPVAPGTEERWTYPPFGGAIAEGYVWGRGAMDMKLTLLGVLEAVEALIQCGFTPQRTLYLAFGHDEELLGEQGAGQIASLLKERDVRLAYVLDEGLVITHGIVPGAKAPLALVGVSEKGYLSVRLSATSEGGHTYAPPPQTCAGIMGAAIYRLETNPLPPSLDGPVGLLFDFAGPEMSFPYKVAFANRWLFRRLIEQRFASSAATNASIRTTMAATMIGGGVRENVLPQSAWAIVNFRLRPGDTVAEVLEHVRRVVADPRVNVEALDGAREASPVSDVGSRSFETLVRTIHHVFPEAIVAPSLLTAATDSRHYQGLADNVYRFIPQRLGPQDVNRIHGVDERVSVTNYAEIIQFYGQLIQESDADADTAHASSPRFLQTLAR